MKNSRFKFEYRKSASKLHRKVGDLLRLGNTFIGSHDVYQEYPVNRVNKSYLELSHHFDWVVPNLKVVIECHGEQHYAPVAFDGDHDKAVECYYDQVARDRIKKEAALQAGYIYIEVPYSAIALLDVEWFNKAYQDSSKELDEYNKDKEDDLAVSAVTTRKAKAKQRRTDSPYHQRALERARELRKKRYKELKDKKNE